MKAFAKSLREKVRHHPSLFRTIRRFPIRLPLSVYRYLSFYGEITVKPQGGQPFKMMHYGYEVENSLFWTGYGCGFEGRSMQLWAKLARVSKVIIDVGANTGVYALAAASMNSSARVIAVEATERVFEKLKSNVAMNASSVEPLLLAASDRDGVAILYDTSADMTYSASLDATMLPDADLRISVPCTKIDSLKASLGLGKVDLIKIDVEKHEPAVLAGMRNILEHDQPNILIEILDEERFQRMQEIVSKFRYNSFFVSEVGIQEGDSSKGRFGNYLLTTSRNPPIG